MRIRSFHIDAFGTLRDVTVEGLSLIHILRMTLSGLRAAMPLKNIRASTVCSDSPSP